MTTGDSINPKKYADDKAAGKPLPYFGTSERNFGLWNHIDAHLQIKGRNITTNPYLDEAVGFTTTFYEMLRNSVEYNELWPYGPLYDDPLERSFRKCSYTVSLR